MAQSKQVQDEMSSYSARPLGDRVVIIHDTADLTIFSELDLEQAGVLIDQLRSALRTATTALRQTAFAPA